VRKSCPKYDYVVADYLGSLRDNQSDNVAMCLFGVVVRKTLSD
jgi:hypothetical protein